MTLMCKQWLTRLRNAVVFVVLSMFVHSALILLHGMLH